MRELSIFTAVAGLLFIFCLSVNATTMDVTEVKCPVCGNRFEAKILMSTNNLGGFDWDFMAWARGAQPVLIIPTTCPDCYYSGYASDFNEELEISKEIRKKIKKENILNPMTEITDAMIKQGIPAYVKYDLIAQTYSLLGKRETIVGNQYINGAYSVRAIWSQPKLSKELDDKLWSFIDENENDELREKINNNALYETELALNWARTLDSKRGIDKDVRLLASLYYLRKHGENAEVKKLLSELNHIEDSNVAAIWRTELEKSIELEKYFQEKAIKNITAGLDQLEDKPTKSANAYLVGELNRRIGNDSEARKYFEISKAIGGIPEIYLDHINEYLKQEN